MAGADFAALWGRSYPQGSASTSAWLTTAVASDGRIAAVGDLNGVAATDLGDGLPVTTSAAVMAIVVRRP